ncbi:dual specificity tyrosine-phosphorylation-regulated kinase 1A-like [Plectropomus leopardus]|uniref:dual specificity tyrosine-phosphorylation-regulated kinase 1A-like n=1 Tax=Plectropomus leopardus TaxID=160734 RepID=UPI001C4CCE94|nr:dual specificity tyrosine-phosphorylation-regulated kinase 1A-like [Plectropomus leopardus]
MADDQGFQVRIGTRISSNFANFQVLNILGSGSYGEVAECSNVFTNEKVAIKILKKQRHTEQAKKEAKILRTMKHSNSEKFNIVGIRDSFSFLGRYCLEFEKLDISLYEFLRRNPLKSLELENIRPIVQQLATALNFLRSVGVVHADLKPANIMMVDHLRQPLKIKVIDFGLACFKDEARTGAILQTLYYRSPEILLGAPFNEAIDVWSLGCIAAEMLMGKLLFPGRNEYDMMRHIFYTIGKPPDHLLNAGRFTRQFFKEQYPRQWRFKSEGGQSTCNLCTINSLSDLKKVSNHHSGVHAAAHQCDGASFVDLVTKMLMIDPAERITPREILQHPFMTTSHPVGMLSNTNKSPDTTLAKSTRNGSMNAAKTDELDNTKEAQSKATQVEHLKRRRPEDEDSGSHKRRMTVYMLEKGEPSRQLTSLPSTSWTFNPINSYPAGLSAVEKPSAQNDADPCSTSRRPSNEASTSEQRKMTDYIKEKGDPSRQLTSLPSTSWTFHSHSGHPAELDKKKQTAVQTTIISKDNSSMLKRKWDGADDIAGPCSTSEGSFPPKKRSVILQEELKKRNPSDGASASVKRKMTVCMMKKGEPSRQLTSLPSTSWTFNPINSYPAGLSAVEKPSAQNDNDPCSTSRRPSNEASTSEQKKMTDYFKEKGEPSRQLTSLPSTSWTFHSHSGHPAEMSKKKQPAIQTTIISKDNSSMLKRKSDGADDIADPCSTSEGSFPPKKRSVILQEELKRRRPSESPDWSA